MPKWQSFAKSGHTEIRSKFWKTDNINFQSKYFVCGDLNAPFAMTFFHKYQKIWRINYCIDSFCFYRTWVVVRWRHLVVTSSIEEFFCNSWIWKFLHQCNQIAQLKLDTNLSHLTTNNYLVSPVVSNIFLWLMQ